MSLPSSSEPDRSPLDPLTADAQHAIDCSHVVLRVFEYIDNETPAPDSARIKAHLDGCAECLGEYERDVLLKALVRRSCGGQTAPGELRSRILSRLTSVVVQATSVQTTSEGQVTRETVRAVEVVDESTDRWDRPAG